MIAFISRVLFVLLALSACVHKSKDPNAALLNHAHQLARDGLLREAKDSYERVLALEPKNPQARRNLGLVSVKLGEYKKAVSLLKEALPYYRENFETHFFLGQAYRAQNQFSEAIYAYQTALNIQPKELRALKALAWSFYKIHVYAEAEKIAMQLTQLAEEDIQSRIILARVLLKQNQSEKAKLVIEHAKTFAKKVDLPYVLSAEGEILLKLKAYTMAQESFRAALKDQPLLAGSLFGLARALWESGQRGELTTQYFERVLRIKPSMREAYYYLGRLSEGKDAKKAQKYYQLFSEGTDRDPELAQLKADAELRQKKLAVRSK